MSRQFDENLYVYVSNVKTLSKNDFFVFSINQTIKQTQFHIQKNWYKIEMNITSKFFQST